MAMESRFSNVNRGGVNTAVSERAFFFCFVFSCRKRFAMNDKQQLYIKYHSQNGRGLNPGVHVTVLLGHI